MAARRLHLVVPFAALLALAFALQAAPASAALSSPWITASNGHFVDTRTGSTVLLRGFDVSVGSSKLYQRAATIGANFVRLTPSWEQLEPNAPVNGVHTYDPTYLSYLDAQVAYYQTQNVNVLIDVHQSGWSSYFSSLSDGTARGMPPWLYTGKYTVDNTGAAQAKADFYTDPQIAQWYRDLLTMLVNRYSGYPNVVGYEILNEPQDGAIDDLQATQTLVNWQVGMAQLVSSLDPQRTVFFQTHSGIDFGVENADLSGFVGLPHVALDVHDYFNGVGGLTQDGESWAPSYDATHNQSTTSYQGTIEQQEGVLVRAIDAARNHGWPLLVGEWGVRTDDTGGAAYQDQMLTLFARYRLSWARWNLASSGIFATLNADNSLSALGQQVKTALASTPAGLANDGVPQVSGTIAFGSTLSATQGQWTGAVSTVAYQWLRCDALGAGCVAIAGATAPTYTVGNADAESRLRVRVNVTGATGSSTALSSATVAAPSLPPLNVALPGVTGQTMLGQVLSANQGAWTGTISGYGYQWLNCDALGANCTPIAGATNATYTSKLGDVGDTIAVRVTSTGPGGATTADSPVTGAIAPLPIVNVTLPAANGVAQVGTQLALDKGTWTGTISGYSYQWLNCDAAGANCTPIAGATNSTYTTKVADVFDTIAVQVMAAGPGGSVTAASPVTAAIAPLPIVNATPPTTTGAAQAGTQLASDKGTWTGTISTYAYQWLSCDSKGANCSPIAGATNSKYTLADGDVGDTVRLQVTATGPGGSVAATAAATAVVVDLAPTNVVQPPLNGTPVLGHGYSLSISLGTWNGSNLVYSYRWKRCDSKGSNCAVISGATAKSYKLTSADLGSTLKGFLTATNSAGSLEVATPLSAVIVNG
jgi:hypothetical protein